MTQQSGVQLEALERERTRLELLLAAEPAWQLLQATPAPDERAGLEARLADNRFYLAHQKLTEAIGLLKVLAAPPARDHVEASTAGRPRSFGIADRIVLIAAPTRTFRTRVKLEARETAGSPDAKPAEPAPTLMPQEIRPASLSTGQSSAANVLKALADTVRQRQGGPTRPDYDAAAPSPLGPATRPGPPPALAVSRLELISGIGPDLAASLMALGVTRFGDIAGWTCEDVARITSRLACSDLLWRHSWIEQAAILAKGGETHYSARVRRGELAAVVDYPATPAEPPRPPAPSSSDLVAVCRLPLPAFAEPPKLENEPFLAPGVTPAIEQPCGEAEQRAPALALPDAERPHESPASPMPPPIAIPAGGAPASVEGLPSAARADRAASLQSRIKHRASARAEPPEAIAAFEADVVIVARQATGPMEPEQGEEPKQSDWRMWPKARDRVDGESYAGYRSRIEEASVEIIQRKTPAPQAIDGSAATSSPSSRSAAKSRRFLKALGD